MNYIGTPADSPVTLSFVVIGYNEAPHLAACIRSIKAANLAGVPYEIIYADGGSRDGGVAVVEEEGVDRILADGKQRRAAANRNRGLAEARGSFVQFLDGDMVLLPDWPALAMRKLESDPKIAVVAGALEELRTDLLHTAMQLDWATPEGETLSCGGAAMFRVSVLRAAGGFPEDIAYGEEPLLCWRIRNEHGGIIWQLNAQMAKHDLAFRGFADYWRRCVRVGTSYAGVAHRTSGTHHEALWSREVQVIPMWAATLLILIFASVLGPWPLWPTALATLAAVVVRKAVQLRRRGETWAVALAYAVHVYFAKLPTAWGILSYRATR